MHIVRLCLIATLSLAAIPAIAGTPAVADFRDRPGPVNRMLEQRLDVLLPTLMREQDIDMWLVIAREYNDDPVYLTLVPQPAFTARRTTMLVFFDRGPIEGVERLTVSRYPLGDLYTAAWEGGDLDAQWVRLAEVVRERNPKRIAINVSADWPVADGLSHGLHRKLENALDERDRGRLVPAEKLVVRWLETRLPGEIELWSRAVSIARGTIAEAFSDAVITPGVTTVDDVAWFIRGRFESLGLAPWFHPDMNVQREGTRYPDGDPFFGDGEPDTVIRRGDVLHTDVGICYLGLCTDTQEMGYVLRVGEREAPEGLRRAMAVGNAWQDLLTGEFKTGRTGNEILAAAQARAADADINAAIYTHPLGVFGHAPGPTIGMWDDQGPTPVRGDWPLHPLTGYAIEGNVKVAVAEFGGQLVQIKLEQSAYFDGERVIYLAGRQTEWHLVR
jgi:Xaa-Pro aminopeptidase